MVVVSGLPASGKTTLAGQLGPLLGLPVIDKDDFLTELLATAPVVDPAERSRLSRLADDEFRHAVESVGRAVVTSFWRRPELSTTSGTPTDWLPSLGSLVEVHCVCDPKTAARRFMARTRHPGHGDAARTFGELCDQFDALAAMGPLGLGRVLTVDTAEPVDVAALVVRIRSTGR